MPRKIAIAETISDRLAYFIEEVDMPRAEPDHQTVATSDLGPSVSHHGDDPTVRGRGVNLSRAAEIFRDVRDELKQGICASDHKVFGPQTYGDRRSHLDRSRRVARRHQRTAAESLVRECDTLRIDRFNASAEEVHLRRSDEAGDEGVS